ncbi:FG-GAP repeat domain-containing protein [Flavobacterium filum]|uniref:FG-GAP repeat domain-containing protein n=1 Tax=Flavobacterium filum TaxID=370974 RepID=UPI00041B2872|nr:VCBS repeat-containing protein [Flavobacterium filum]
MRKIIFLFFLTAIQLNAQINFSNENILIDGTHHSSDVTSIVTSDLDNDGFKEVIVGSSNSNSIIFYKNINGDIQYYQRQIIYENTQANFSSNYEITCSDLDSDGLNDIIVVSGFEDKLFWFKNLGNFNFSLSIIINSTIDNPRSIVSLDIDNDGDNDIIVGSFNHKNVSIFRNNGDGNFSNQEIIYTVSSGINRLVLKDLDNNGFLDIISGQNDGGIFWVKNINGSNFSTPNYITGSADNGTGFDFIDINNDSYFDIIFSSSYQDNIKYVLNLNGNIFSTNSIIIDNNISDPFQVKAVDFDYDGLLDVVISTYTNDKIGWYKNNNGIFSSLLLITNNIFNPKEFVVEDINNDDIYEIISSSYELNNSSRQKLSIFKKNDVGIFKENIINFYFSNGRTAKIADLNNDGMNDVISALGSVVWNKNLGNNVFSSQKLISSNIMTLSVHDLEISDINNDNFLDVICVNNFGLEVYKNNGDETFDLVLSLPLTIVAGDIEVVDINNDGNKDIILSYHYINTNLIKLVNSGNFNFQPLENILSPLSGNSLYKIKCGDLDNDGHIDIVIISNEYSRINWLKNDGIGNFNNYLIQNSISLNNIDLADIDNDNDLDIISSSYSGNQNISLIKNNGNGTFLPPINIDNELIKSLSISDINNDGYLDIVGFSTNLSLQNEKIFYFLGNGSTFDNKIIIETLVGDLAYYQNLSFGDLNNDNKIDFVTASYTTKKTIKFYINNTTLSVLDNNIKNNIFAFSPNPSNDIINWSDQMRVKRIMIFDLLGKEVYNKLVVNNYIRINEIPKGIYIIKAISENENYISKLIIN